MNAILQRALSQHQQGNLAEAERLYREVLAQTPEQPDTLALLGVLCDGKGDHAQAIDLITRACRHDPLSGLFKFHLGTALLNTGRDAEAVVAFRQAVTLQPQLAEAHYNLGNALRRIGSWVEAIDAYKQAIALKPDNPEIYNNLALAFTHEKDFAAALDHAKRAVALAPDYGAGWLTLCNVAEQCKDYALALEAGEHNTRLMPDNHRAWFGYGVALNRLDRNEDAVEAYKRALALKPDRADIWDNLAQTYQSLNRLEEAEATFRKTIEVAGQVIDGEDSREVDESEYGNRHWHLALMELLRGKYKPGFARYRSRFKEVGGLVRPNYSRPLWRGEDLNGKTILIWDEQGFGDTLMLCRYLPLMKKRGAKIVLSVHPVLKPLLEGWSGVDKVIVHGDSVSGHDFHASAFDLPHIFGTEIDTIPMNVPYLPQPAPDDATRLDGNGKPKIGVVWGGSPSHSNDARRSVPLKLMARLFENKDFQFFSLNRDMKPGDATLLPTLPVIDLAPRLKSFADGARLIGQMDLVISCDTATVHLAGGLGKKTWTLLPYAPDWRWLTDRSDSVWYPSMRLFRQPAISDWDSVIHNVQQALEEWT